MRGRPEAKSFGHDGANRKKERFLATLGMTVDFPCMAVAHVTVRANAIAIGKRQSWIPDKRCAFSGMTA
jgi:hypothetical protein